MLLTPGFRKLKPGYRSSRYTALRCDVAVVVYLLWLGRCSAPLNLVGWALPTMTIPVEFWWAMPTLRGVVVCRLPGFATLNPGYRSSRYTALRCGVVSIDLLKPCRVAGLLCLHGT